MGIAVRNIRESERLFTQLLGVSPYHVEDVKSQEAKIVSYRIGEVTVELTAPTSDDSPIARFIAKRGEGLHHVAFVVDDIHSEMDRLRRGGFHLVTEAPEIGAESTQIAFLHPKSTGGVLVELVALPQGKSTNGAPSMKDSSR
ncbi:MAG: methylmalonyl-CoA epimerase [Bacteroidota bacterium]